MHGNQALSQASLDPSMKNFFAHTSKQQFIPCSFVPYHEEFKNRLFLSLGDELVKREALMPGNNAPEVPATEYVTKVPIHVTIGQLDLAAI